MVSFYISKSSGQVPLMIRVRRSGIDIKLTTGITVDAVKWIKRKKKAVTMAAVSRIQDAVESMIGQTPDPSSAQIRAILLDCYRQEARRRYLRDALGPVTMTLNRYIDLYLSEIREGKRLSHKEIPFASSSIKSIGWAISVFADYQQHRGLKLDFDDIDIAFLEDFRLYMEQVRKFKVNTVSKCIKELKTIMGKAKFERLTDNPYFDDKHYGVARREVSSIALNNEEMYRFCMVDVSSMGGKAQLAKDLFIAGVCTCQRHSDFCKLGAENLEKVDVNGNQVWMLHFKQQKTGAEVAIPCRPELKAILRKYGYTIPTMTLQIMNRHLKKIAKAAGLDSPVRITEFKAGEERTYSVPKWTMVTTHVARRTGATLMYYMGVDVYDIMRITGHRSPEMLRKYIKAEPYDTIRKLYNSPFFKGE